MARRQPYAHVNEPLYPDAPHIEDDPTFEYPADDGGIEVILEDDGLLAPDPEPQIIERSEPKQQQRRQAPSADDEAYNRLKAQLDRETENRRRAEARLGEVEQGRTAAEERARQAEQDQYVAQELAIENALVSKKQEAEAAEERQVAAMQAGDFVAAAKWAREAAKAENDISRLSEGKQHLEVQKTRKPAAPTRQPDPAPQSQNDRVEAYINQEAHSPRVREYMRKNYDDLFGSGTDKRVNKLIAAHMDAKAENIVDGSDEYFEHLDRFMGYDDNQEAAPPPRQQQRQQPQRQPQQQQKQRIPPAAPVNRNSSDRSVVQDGRQQRVYLTPAEVDFCRKSDIDPKQYAMNKAAIARGGKDPNWTGPRFTGDQ